ncbi:MAG TPA: SRPBCC family protein [Reyranella sp.]|nr:SRPBCC family protein [Reyranella sp.]
MSDMTLKPQGDREIVVVRAFNAPRDLVFDAFTKPELVQRWMLGTDGWSMPVCRIDFKVGGKGRYEWKSPDGKHGMALSAEFVEIERPARIVHKEIFDGTPKPIASHITSTFVEEDGRTTLTMVIRYPTPEVRDFMLKSGMEKGMALSFTRLEKMVS